jgi:hypothetical protein
VLICSSVAAASSRAYVHVPGAAVDLVQLAIDGKLDPVIGRDEEIRRVIQILCRRTKNNPVSSLRSSAGAGCALFLTCAWAVPHRGARDREDCDRRGARSTNSQSGEQEQQRACLSSACTLGCVSRT